MKRICTGTMITLIYQARAKKSAKVRDICRSVFDAYGCDIDSYGKELPSHLKSGHDPMPKGVYDSANDSDPDEIIAGFKQHVLGLIDNGKREALVRAIKAILAEDTSISDHHIVGYDGFSKKTILECTSFGEADLLASVCRFAILIDNSGTQAAVKEIPADFVDSFIDSDDEVYFRVDESDQDEVSALKRTLKSPWFDRIFKKAVEINVNGMANPSKACVYYVDPTNCKFRFSELKSFIVDNIGSYVFSRAKAQRIQERAKDRSAIGSQEMLKFAVTYGANAESVLGEILLYIFLEQALDAPKIMSKIEMDEANGNAVSKSDGVHLLRCEDTGSVFHQLVFGASDITGDIKKAVDRAFEQILAIEDNYDMEFHMVDNTTQWTIYDPDATKFMVELMTPQRDGTYKPDMAFGAFLGYSLKLDQPVTNSQKYKEAVVEQLKKDIQNAQSYIAQKITDCGYSGYSFYFYVLPFNDAPDEKVSIIKEILSGGVY